jgi:hypothetical protein
MNALRKKNYPSNCNRSLFICIFQFDLGCTSYNICHAKRMYITDVGSETKKIGTVKKILSITELFNKGKSDRDPNQCCYLSLEVLHKSVTVILN